MGRSSTWPAAAVSPHRGAGALSAGTASALPLRRTRPRVGAPGVPPPGDAWAEMLTHRTSRGGTGGTGPPYAGSARPPVACRSHPGAYGAQGRRAGRRRFRPAGLAPSRRFRRRSRPAPHAGFPGLASGRPLVPWSRTRRRVPVRCRHPSAGRGLRPPPGASGGGRPPQGVRRAVTGRSHPVYHLRRMARIRGRPAGGSGPAASGNRRRTSGEAG